MDLALAGRTALVTGASKGIGLGVAETLAAEGVNVHLVSRTAADLETARDAIAATSSGASVTIHPLDLSDSANVDKLLAECGDVDILVNNAGAIPAGDVLTIDEQTWRKAWDLKVFGYINMTRAFFGRMKARGDGVILNIVGLAGEKPDSGYVAGSAGNASLMAFSRAVGGNSLDHGVRVLAINPGPVQTDRIVTLMRTRAEKEFGDAAQWQRYFARMPMGRAASVAEVADLAVFLVSDKASYISGVVYTVDGGINARSASF